MSIFAKMLGLDPDSYLETARQLYANGEWGHAKIEFEKTLELTPKDATEVLDEIRNAIAECREKLSIMHEEWADSCMEAQEYEKAAEEFRFALDLHGNGPRHGSLHRKSLDARRAHYHSRSLTEVTPFITRGDEFLAEKHYNGALVEFQEAMRILKFFSPEDQLKKEVLSKLSQVEESLVKPYLERGENLVSTKLFDEAIQEYEKALSLVSVNEKVIEKIQQEIQSVLNARGTDTRADDDEVFISREEWDKALGDYAKLLEMYFSYSNEGADPYKAYHANRYEAEFKKAKQMLGSLYIRRADGYYNLERFAVALKYYVESQDFFDDDDNESAYLRERIGDCKQRL